MTRVRKKIETVAIVICHGKSEKILAEFFKSNLKIPILILAENKGRNSIQVGKSLENFLNSHLKNKSSLLALDSGIVFQKNVPVNLKIFPIIDLDDTEDQNIINNYKNGAAFRRHWLSDCFVPIYNDRNLEQVFKSMEIPYAQKGNKGKHYLKAFPVQKGKSDLEAIYEFRDKCQNCSRTNMDELINFLIKYAILVDQIKR